VETSVAQVMTESPVWVAPDEPLRTARALMMSCGFRQLPVEEHGWLTGLVTLDDLLAAELAAASESELTVAAAMRRDPPSIDADASACAAAHRLLDEHLSCLTALSHARLRGILTRADFVKIAVDAMRHLRAAPRVEQVMTPRPLQTLRPDDTLDRAHALMLREGVRHLPVLDGEQLVGLLSDHDLLVAVDGKQRGLSAITVHEAMRPHILIASPDDWATDAGEQLRRRRFGAMPVLRRHRLVGMLTVCDYFSYWVSSLPACRAHTA
jgi:CBS domain-containing protein